MFLEQVLQRADCKAPRCENVWFAMPFCTDNQTLSPRQARDHLQQRLRNDVSAGLGSDLAAGKRTQPSIFFSSFFVKLDDNVQCAAYQDRLGTS